MVATLRVECYRLDHIIHELWSAPGSCGLCLLAGEKSLFAHLVCYTEEGDLQFVDGGSERARWWLNKSYVIC